MGRWSRSLGEFGLGQAAGLDQTKFESASIREIAALVVLAVERQAGVLAEPCSSRMYCAGGYKRHAHTLAVWAWRFVTFS
jgi:hypothetical protein